MRGARPEAEGEIMTGRDVDGVAKHDADHFMKCPGCGQWFDMRDVGQVIEHVHDAEIEISEGPAPSRKDTH
jgi:uncharacterized C2H2 Zn-finger protein